MRNNVPEGPEILAAGQSRGRQPPYLADMRAERALSASAFAKQNCTCRILKAESLHIIIQIRREAKNSFLFGESPGSRTNDPPSQNICVEDVYADV